MSLDELRADLARNIAEAKRITNVQELRDHLVNTLWPWLEAQLDVVDEMDDELAEREEPTEDFLNEDSVAVFATIIQGGLALAAELKKRAPGDAQVLQATAEYEQLCEQAVVILSEVSIPNNDNDDEEDEDDDEEGEGDEDEAKETGHEQ